MKKTHQSHIIHAPSCMHVRQCGMRRPMKWHSYWNPYLGINLHLILFFSSWMWFSFITKLMHILIRSVCFPSVTRCARYNVNGLSLSVTQYRGTNRLIEKSRSCTIVNRVFWFVNDSVTSSCTIILRIRKWFLDGKPQLLLIKETIINYLFAVPFHYCISLLVYAPKLSLI